MIPQNLQNGKVSEFENVNCSNTQNNYKKDSLPTENYLKKLILQKKKVEQVFNKRSFNFNTNHSFENYYYVTSVLKYSIVSSSLTPDSLDTPSIDERLNGSTNQTSNWDSYIFSYAKSNQKEIEKLSRANIEIDPLCSDKRRDIQTYIKKNAYKNPASIYSYIQSFLESKSLASKDSDDSSNYSVQKNEFLQTLLSKADKDKPTMSVLDKGSAKYKVLVEFLQSIEEIGAWEKSEDLKRFLLFAEGFFEGQEKNEISEDKECVADRPNGFIKLYKQREAEFNRELSKIAFKDFRKANDMRVDETMKAREESDGGKKKKSEDVVEENNEAPGDSVSCKQKFIDKVRQIFLRNLFNSE